MEEHKIAQTITKELITRQADTFKRDLPVSFWNIQPWKNQYRVLIMRVNSLMKTYEPEAVHNAIMEDKQGKKIYSLKYPGLDDLIVKHERLLAKKELIKEKEVVINKVDVNAKPRESFGKKSIKTLLE